MLKILIIVFVIALCIGPILYLAPSLRQKRIAELRRIAAQKGLSLKTVRNPMMNPQHKPGPDDQMYVTVYSRKWRDEPDYNDFRKALQTLEPSLLVKEEYEHGTHFLGKWEKKVFPKHQQAYLNPLETLASNLDDDIVGIEVNNEGAGVYWNENTGLKDASDEQAKSIRMAKLNAISDSLNAFVEESKSALRQQVVEQQSAASEEA